MGRVNKTIEGVFVDIVGDATTISSYDAFMNLETKKSSKELKGYLNEYKKLVDKSKADLEKMAALEEIIMQIRVKENPLDIKISAVRDYVYARCPFYRKDKSSKDIRIIIDHFSFWKDRAFELENIPELQAKAKEKILAVMETEIAESTHNFKEKYKSISK